MKTAFDLAQIPDSLFLSPADVARFFLAGACKMGLANTQTGVRHTYSIEVKKALTPRGGYSPAHGEGPWFVSVHDGDGEWAFLGTVQRWLNPKTGAASHTYKPSPKSKYGAGSPQQRGAAFLAAFVDDASLPMPAPLRVWREATCARCGEDLFSEFVALGFGPVCAKKLGLTPPKKAKTAKVIPFPVVAA